MKGSGRLSRWAYVGLAALALAVGLHIVTRTSLTSHGFVAGWLSEYRPSPAGDSGDDEVAKLLVDAAQRQTTQHVVYDPAYVVISYPGGDVPPTRGVCADVVVRAYREIGADLQVEVHEDMEKNFFEYPKIWRMSRTDTNIDHRRVANLITFFRRRGTTLPADDDPVHYTPGNIVAWDLGRGVLHIGLVSDTWSADHRRRLVIHNIGAGPQEEDVLFRWRVIGNFTYRPKRAESGSLPGGPARARI